MQGSVESWRSWRERGSEGISSHVELFPLPLGLTYPSLSLSLSLSLWRVSCRIPDLKERMEVASFVFLDHCKPCYLPDLQAMEDTGLIGKGTTVVADNVLYPGAPDFLKWVDTSVGRYKTDLIPADFEYDQVWKKDWVRPKDAMSHSVYVGNVADAP